MNRLTRLAVVLVPALGLAGLWANSDHTYHLGTEWDVPVAGYDPRDFLRGHYVAFTYDWPGIDVRRDVPLGLCLEGDAPTLVRVVAANTAAERGACDHPLRADTTRDYGESALISGRLYIGQDRASALEGQLANRDQRGIVTIRQREDGSFTPIAIRFRPLTPAEIAERDAQAAENARRFAPPAIMEQ